jgi:ABC-type sugar transport system ATPase subunit
MSDALFRCEHVNKGFFGVPVVKDLSLEIGRGRVLGLVGQNGAGKSTLMNLIGGNLALDTGAMWFDGAPYAPASARDAEKAGIAFIHQELNLFSNLSIAENIFLSGMPKGGGGLIDRGALRQRTAELLHEVDLDLSPDMLVERLSPGERQLVEVTKALHLDAKLVIFDEPTTSLTPRETVRLFALIGRLRAAGKAIVYISHILADVAALADDVAVLRDGRLVASGPVAAFPAATMINAMLGRDIEQLYPPHVSAVQSETVLEARGLSLRGVVKDISFSLKRGEVLGLFGLMGAGRTELARILFGLDHFHRGELIVGGEPVARQSPRNAIASRMAFITENRREEGLMMNVAIGDNIGLAALPRFSRAGFLDERQLLASASELATALQIKSGAIDLQPARSLSGGNQQKVVIAKWLMAGPAIFILDEPTRGIDVAAKYEIYTIIKRLASEGCGILLISSEIEEAMAMCDRILVMRQGEASGEFAREQFGKEPILRAAFGQEGQAA